MKMKSLFVLTLVLLAGMACNLVTPALEEQAEPEPTEIYEEETATQPAEEPVETALPVAKPTQAAAAISPGGDLDPSPLAETVKLIFIHHSSGENWLADENGGLGLALMENNYFVSDTNYGWGPGNIGDLTDIGNWWEWFVGPRSERTMKAVYKESGQNSSYSRLENDPGGENVVVMFKSCFPNSALGGNPNDPPTMGENPLRGQDASSEHHTVANARGIYNDLLAYFQTRPDRLFIVITAPPLGDFEGDAGQAANARALNRWLVEDWLSGYPLKNVAVFDFYNVLTSSGGDPDTNDAGAETGNHHRFWGGVIQYVTDQGSNFSAYAAYEDSHPTTAGNQKATAEFVTLLNIFYQRWLASQQ